MERRKKSRSREIIVVALVCMVCLSAVAAGNYFLNREDKKSKDVEKEIVNLNSEKNETTDKKKVNVAVDGNVVKEEETTSKKTGTIIKETIKPDNSSETDKSTGKKINKADVPNQAGKVEVETTTKKDEIVNVNSAVSTLDFNEDSEIEWPVQGNVLLDYSMENTIYFPTLDTYKCNPAIIIQSEKGTEVKAGVKGIVKEVTTEDEIGNCIIMEIGNGYEITYGQLSDIKVSKGDTVEANTCIGLVAETTRYYKNEGINLYLKITKDGEPCDPMDYLK